MFEVDSLALVSTFRTYAVGLCVGVSSLVLTLYFYLVAKGRTLPEQGKMMHVAYTLLRVGMSLAVISELAAFAYHYQQGNSDYWAAGSFLWIRITVFSVIVVNAFAMQKRLISMWLGPVFAGGSWYAYFFFSVWPQFESSYTGLLTGYLIWLLGFGIFLALLRISLTRQQQHFIGDGSDAVAK